MKSSVLAEVVEFRTEEELKEMARAVYVDTSPTAINGKRKKKPHYVYDGEKVFEVNKLTNLKDVDEVHIDTLFPEIYEEVLELLKRGVKVYLLKDIRMLKKLRMENNMKKSDENDAVLLSKISKDGFRLLTIQETEKKVKLRPLINRHELLSKRIKTLKQWINRDGYDYKLKDSIRLMEKDKKDVAKKIIKILSNDTIYREACRMLGVKDSVELAILTVELPLHLPITRLKGLLGYTPDKNKGRYDHKLRGHITNFAVSLYMNTKRHVNVLDNVVEIVDRLPMEKAIYKLELMALKALRIAYILTTSNQTFNNPIGR